MKTLDIVLAIMGILLTICIQALAGEEYYPPEAYQACEGRKAGEVGHIVNKRGVVLEGKCQDYNGVPVIINPEWRDVADEQNMTLSPEARKACIKKKQGDKSKYMNKHGLVIEGTCEYTKGKLVLFPIKRKTVPSAKDPVHRPTDIISACAGKRGGDVAYFVNPTGKTINGKCEDRRGKILFVADQKQNR